ncbi:MAG: type II secretion system F family protein [Candidatus Schekmanbacteria bacterium]|nr:MAG: type II secretion system F family protein [Candidatus Schekmanbacteria bacterium]
MKTEENILSLPALKVFFEKVLNTDFKRKKVTLKELILFTNQLHLMLEMDSGLVPSLKAISEEMENEELKKTLKEIISDVEEGQRLSSAMKKHPSCFSPLFVSMIKVGESGGVLNEMLKRLAAFQESWEKMVSNLKSATTYPFILLLFCFGVVIFVLSFVLPRFVKIFQGNEDLLPTPTKILLELSYLLNNYWFFILTFLLILLCAGYYLLQKDEFRSYIDSLKLQFPIVGRLFTNVYIARMMRLMGVLLDAGIPLLETIEVTKSTMDNKPFYDFMNEMEDNVKNGKKLSLSYENSKLMPPSVRQMVVVGEESGALGKVMSRMADFYDEETERTIKRITTLIEPTLIVLMGAIVGFIAVSIILPIFKMSSTIGR